MCIRDSTHILSTLRAKVTLENKHGDTALDVAKNWGDDYIYAIVYAKVATLPPAVDKKGTVYRYTHVPVHVYEQMQELSDFFPSS